MIDLHRQKRIFQTPGIMLIILGFSGLLGLGVSWEYHGRFWKEWYPLLISSADCNSHMEEYLGEITGGQLVSESNSYIRYNGYNSPKQITLEDLRSGEGLYSLDPRLDPYMKGSLAYFNQGIFRIFYLPSNHSPLRYFWVLSRNGALRHAEWFLPDADFSLPEVLVFVFLILMLCWRSFRFSIPGALILGIGFLSVWAGQNQSLLILSVFALFVRLILSGYQKNPWVWIFMLLSAGLALYGKFINLRLAAALGCLAAVSAGSFQCLPSPGIVQGKRGQDHNLFEPVSLLSDPGRQPGGKILAEVNPVMIAASLMVLILCLMNLPGVRVLPADFPVAVSTSGSWKAGNLNPSGIKSPLPDTEDYLRHRAYQDAFMYGGNYELPQTGGGVTIDDYALDKGRISETKRRVFEFTSSWFEQRLDEMADSGPARLLRSESAPPVVRVQSSVMKGIPLHVLFAFAALIVIYVLIHISGIHPAHSRAGRNYGKSFFVLRRKQQAA